MGVVSYRLMDEVEVALKQTFKPDYSTDDVIVFRNKLIKHDDFTLFIKHIENDEIVLIAEILENVYRNFPTNQHDVNWSRETLARDFNQQTEESSKFVQAVLELKGSALHKLLLLTSGNFMLSDENADLVTILAKAKPEWCTDSAMLEKHPNAYIGLKNLYILPTIAVHTMSYADKVQFTDQKTTLTEALSERDKRFYVGLKSRESLDFAVRLLTFFVTKDLELTFSEHRKSDFSKIVKTINSLGGFDLLNTIQDLLLSNNYKELAESLTVQELYSLTRILLHQSYTLDLPTMIFKRRAKAMATNKIAYVTGRFNSVGSYLSDQELNSIEGMKVVKHFDSALKGPNTYRDFPSFVYAAFSEVISSKGVQKAMDVLKEVSHASVIGNLDTDDEAKKALISLLEDYLNSDDEMPFGWFAQLSEHAWCLQPQPLKDTMDLTPPSILKLPAGSIKFTTSAVV